VSELLLATHDISDEEFARGRNKLKSDMFMDLESRIVQIDDVIRQVLLWNKRVTAAEHAQKIDAVTKEDVMRAARQILQGAPIVVAHGPKSSIDAVAGSRRIHAHLLKLLKPVA
jgi:processing peptidase subunit alpha